MEDTRKKAFKQGTNYETERRRRADTGVQIRKQKREEGVAKRRNVTATHSVEPQAPGTPAPAPRRSYTLSEIPTLTLQLSAPAVAERMEGARGLRKLLSTETSNPPAQRVVEAGALPGLVAILSLNGHRDAQFEAAWALTNIASTNMTSEVANAGAIPPLCALLMHADPDIRDQSAWCLGNIAGDGPALRDAVLAGGALPGLLANAAQPHGRSLLKNVTWTLSNLCRGRPAPPMELVTQLAPVLAKLLHSVPDGASGGEDDVRIDAAWALSYLSDGENERVNEVVRSGAIAPLVEMLCSSATQCVTPALRAIGNIVTGDELPTQAVIEANALPAVSQLLRHRHKGVRKEACWMASNVAAGTRAQIDELCRSEGMITGLVRQLATGEHDVQKEAAWAVSNIATGGTKVHVASLVAAGGIAALCGQLAAKDAKVVNVCLEAIQYILTHDASVNNAYSIAVEECEGITALEDLQSHENEKIYRKAVDVIEKYFGGEAEDANGGEENLEPQQSGNGFAFGSSTSANGLGFGNPGLVASESTAGGFDFGGVF